MSDAGNSPPTNVDLARPAPPDADIVVGPPMADGDIGIYPPMLAELADLLREQGVTVALAHDEAHRSPGDQRGPVADMVIEAALGVAGGGALEAVKFVFGQLRNRTGGSREVEVDLRVGTGPDARRMHITGTAQDVADAAARLIPGTQKDQRG